MIYKVLEVNQSEDIEETTAVGDTLDRVGWAMEKKIDDTKQSIKHTLDNFKKRKDPAVKGRKEYLKKQKLRQKQGLE